MSVSRATPGHGNKKRYDAARAEIGKAQAQLQNALDGLGDIGFTVG